MRRNYFANREVFLFKPFLVMNSRFVDRSKYVWTANKQQQPSQPQPPPPSASLPLPLPKPVQVPVPAPAAATTPAPVPTKPPQQQPPVKQNPPQQSVQIVTRHTLVKKNNPNHKELPPLSVTVLDPPHVVANDIAAKLNEEKVYLISKLTMLLAYCILCKMPSRIYDEFLQIK